MMQKYEKKGHTTKKNVKKMILKLKFLAKFYFIVHHSAP